MNDLISRQAAIRLTCGTKCGCEPDECGLTMERDGTEQCTDVQLLMSLPSVQPERKTGRWIDEGYDIDGTHYIRCSSCECSIEGDVYDYCPNCGAYMRGEKDE